MDNLSIILIIAVFLFARLGIRLLMGYEEMKNEKDEAKEKTLQMLRKSYKFLISGLWKVVVEIRL